MKRILLGLSVVALLYSSPSQGQDKKPVLTHEMVFKGTLTGLEQEVVHSIPLKKDRTYNFTTESRGFFTKMRMENCQGQKIPAFEGSSIFKAPEDGLFRLYVSSPGGSTGQYVVSVRSMNLTPIKAGEILSVGPDGINIDGVLAKDDPLDKVRKKHCRIFEVRMNSGKRYLIDLTSSQFDAYLRLENAGGKQLAEDDDSGDGNNARIRFKAPSDGIYRVIATTYNLETGQFLLKIREDGKSSKEE